jgi:hypothetical protein
MQILQEAQTKVNLLSRDLSQSCSMLQTDRQQMFSEIDRTEKIGEMIRKCVYEASEMQTPLPELPGSAAAPDEVTRRPRRDEAPQA